MKSVYSESIHGMQAACSKCLGFIYVLWELKKGPKSQGTKLVA